MKRIILVVPLRSAHRLMVRQTRASRDVIAALANGVLAANAVGVARLHGSADERLPGVRVDDPDVLPGHSVRVETHSLEGDVGGDGAAGGCVPEPWASGAIVVVECVRGCCSSQLRWVREV